MEVVAVVHEDVGALVTCAKYRRSREEGLFSNVAKKKRKKRFFKNGVEMKILKQRCSNFVLYVLLALKHFMSLTLSLSMFSSLSGKLILLSGVGPLWMKTAAAVP